MNARIAPEGARIGLIGLGSMGAPMALNLLAAHGEGAPASVGVYGRTPARLAPLVAAGARAAALPRDLAAESDAVILMLPDLPQIHEVLWGEDGIVSGVAGPLLLIICSSVSPEGVREIASRALAETAGRLRVVDAPVSGGTEGAEAGTLSIMLGGSREDTDLAAALLAPTGRALRMGELGAGQVAKACNQVIVAATMTAIAEAALIAERSGLDLAQLLPLLQGGYAGSRVLETKAQRLIDRDYSVAGAAGFMVKDLRAAAEEAERVGARAPMLDTLRGVFDALVEAGLGEQDLAVVHRYLDEAGPAPR